MKTIKVFGGNWGGIERRIVATTSLTKACQLTGITNNYISETGNAIELEVAKCEVGIVFGYNTSLSNGHNTTDFVRIADKNRQLIFQSAIQVKSND